MKIIKEIIIYISCFIILMLLILGNISFAGGNFIMIDPLKPIEVDGGYIIGKFSKNKEIAIYKGIPYAAPPLGELRWKPPAPVKPWNGVKECVDFGPSCIQPPQAPFGPWSKEFIIDTSKGYSEDCLTLNIWTKVGPSYSRKPVIVYIHGGANISGGSSCEVYDGEKIAQKDVVFVSINYRLGILGFLAHPELSKESPDKISGNYAILDQISALKWIKKNISKFGGDPENITLLGQSAGAFNINFLIISPMARGLFNNAVILSGNYVTYKMPSLKEKEEEGKQIFQNMTLEEMRKIKAEDLLKLRFSAQPCLDGKVFTHNMIDAFKNGVANDVNIIIGYVTEDTQLFPVINTGYSLFNPLFSLTKEEYTGIIKKNMGDLADECLKIYPPTNDCVSQLNNLLSDGMMAMTYLYAKIKSTKSQKPIYIYQFTHIMPGRESMRWKAFHTSDVPYWLNYFSPLREEYWAKIDFKIGEKMSSYLTNFAKINDPNGIGLEKWEPFNKDEISYQNLGDEFYKVKFEDNKYEFWNKFLNRLVN